MWVLTPTVKVIHRKCSGSVTVGDYARASLDLKHAEQIEHLIGPGFRFAQSAALLPALRCAEALLQVRSTQRASPFSLKRVSVNWVQAASTPRKIAATARVQALLGPEAKFSIEGRVENATHYHGVAIYEIRARVDPEVPSESSSLFTVISAPESLALGTAGTVALRFHDAARVRLLLPFGNGLRVGGSCEFDASPGVREFEIIADRPHEVNLGNPWLFWIEATNGKITEKREFAIRVLDPEPGRIFYLLTEDCETFDGGPLTGNYGDAACLGNHNNFMDPEDYLVQMVAKPGKMNEIANRHGARWTHFWAVHQRFAAEWARNQSATSQWDKVVEALDISIRKGAGRHEYAPHLHCDYEPDSMLPPQPRLVYDPVTDGILPNDYYDPISNPTHRYHDWDGAARGGPGIKKLGWWDDPDSKAGSLFKGLHHLAQLQVHNRPLLCARTGSFDFGATSRDQQISTQAYELAILRANSDARFTADEPVPGGHLFWCRPDDRFQRISDLRDASLIQMAVTRDVSFERLDDVNGWFERHWPSCRGAGVHGLVIMTHAMFMRGMPDPFRSLEGGAFEILDQHLAWVRENYPDVQFATASEAVMEFLDYYTPNLLGIADPRLIQGNPKQGRFVFSVRLLGRGIFVGPEHPAQISIQAPPCFKPSDILSLRVLGGAGVLGETEDARITVRLFTKEVLMSLEVTVREHAVAKMSEVFLTDLAWPLFHHWPEHREPFLFVLDMPIRRHYSMDALRMLTHPLAGERAIQEPVSSLPAILIIGAFLEQARQHFFETLDLSLDFEFASESLNQDFIISGPNLDGGLKISATAINDQILATARITYLKAAVNQPLPEDGSWRSKFRNLISRSKVFKRFQNAG